jgi:hypothetical protein
MAADPTLRRLTTILAADVAGYSRLTGADEEGTLARIRALRGEVIDPVLAATLYSSSDAAPELTISSSVLLGLHFMRGSASDPTGQAKLPTVTLGDLANLFANYIG